MNMIMITAPSSNTGKTTLTLGIIRALKNRGIDISAFKTGPDFLDTKYLGLAAKKTAGNLDMHIQGKDGIRQAIAMNTGELGIIEGAMGYFDGIGNTFKNSSYDISRELDIPSILVYTPKGEMFSVIPKIKGMVDFEESKISGVILNKTSKMMYIYLKEQIEKYIGIKVLGYVPLDHRLKLESRSLGLDDSYTEREKEELIAKLAHIMEKTVDLDEILKLSRIVEYENYIYPKKRDIIVGIASDEVFSFHYSENLKILEKICQVEYFSPLRDEKIPEADLIYIGGGYPELYSKELSENQSMIESIREYIEKDGYLIAEGGALMYLTDSIEDEDMVGIIEGKSVMTDRLKRFGYVNIQTKKDTIYGPAKTILVGNEYHKSEIHSSEENIFEITKPMSNRVWKCGYMYKNMIGYYQHINFLGNMHILENLFNNIEQEKGS